jgi:hypothetical protein
VRPLQDLIDSNDPGIDLVRDWVREAARPVEFLPRSSERSEVALLAMQVTTRSPMGALTYETGGLLVDTRWVRVLGGGCERLPGIDQWNRFDEQGAMHRFPGALIVGWDALGGFFAVNGGAFGGELGHVFYFAQDTLEWESLERGYSDWLCFLFSGDLAGFYEDQRWSGWEGEVAQVPGDRGISVAPPLFTKGPPIGERSRRSVPLEELWGMFVREEGSMDLPDLPVGQMIQQEIAHMADPAEIKRREQAALAAIQSVFGTQADEYGVTLFVSHHLEEIESAYWQEHLGSDRPEARSVLGLLQLRSHWGDEGEEGIDVFDFSLPGDVTNYVISVRFDETARVETITMES